ncbi:MAG: DNRLRE domain-containing protein [Planctomycetes bacterium]|nr:DNRLRE domain-containing protein [Planctomycetota bacterium]
MFTFKLAPFALLAAVLPAQIQTTTIAASDATMVRLQAPDQNYASNQYLYAAGANSTDGTRRILLNFDLTSLGGHAIRSAKLRVHCNVGTKQVHVHRATSAWEQSTATWNNQPSFDAQVEAVTTAFPSRWKEFDVTTLVRSWVDGQYPNEGVVLRHVSEATHTYQVSIYSVGADRPQLVVESSTFEYGASCGFPVTLSGSPAPGSTFRFEAPTPGAQFVQGYAAMLLGATQESLDLFPLGLPGCALLTSTNVAVEMAYDLPSATFHFEMAAPTDPSMSGVTWYWQGLHYDLLTQQFGTSQGFGTVFGE